MPNLPSLIPTSVSVERGRNLMATTISVPLGWLVIICALLLFNGGVIYSQFDTIKKQTATSITIQEANVNALQAINTRVDLISQRVTSGEARMTAADTRQTSQDDRLRQIELNVASLLSRMDLSHR